MRYLLENVSEKIHLRGIGIHSDILTPYLLEKDISQGFSKKYSSGEIPLKSKTSL